ncbi:hypothetical protein [Spirosoma areae]
MKQTALLFFTITLFLNQEACRSRQQADSQPTDSTTTADAAATAETPANITITGRLADLGLTPDSHWRGINLGDAFNSVNATEKGESFEKDATHVGYTVELKNLETADMLYYQTGQFVSAINVDLFLNSRPSVDAYQTELSAYFTARYGSPKPGDEGSVWAGRRGETVTLKDVSKGKDFGLKIKINTTGTTTASAK